MSDNLDTIQPALGGLNTDDDLTVIPTNDSRYRLNVTRSEDSSHMVLSNMMGTELIWNAPEGYSEGDVIGSVEDKENKAIIFFVYLDNESSIIRYNQEDDSVDYIINGATDGNTLGFSGEKYVDAWLIGSGDNQYLIWTDGDNPIGYLNVTYAFNYTNGGSPAYTSLSADTISLYKKPLLFPISCSYADDTSVEENNLTGSIWQFAVRLKYYDNTFSTISAYSPIPIPTEQEGLNSIQTNNNQKNNRLDISFDLTYPTDIVTSYQLIYRSVDIGSGNPGNWEIYQNYNYNTIGTQTVQFFNDGNIGTVSSDQVARIFDYLPDKADHLSLIDSNRVVAGGVTEGYENIEIDVELDEINTTFTYDETTLKDVSGVGSSSYNIPLLSEIDSNDYYHRFEFGILTEDVDEVSVFSSFGLDTDAVGAYLEGYFNSIDIGTGNFSYNPATNILTISASTTCSYRYDVVSSGKVRSHFLSDTSNSFGIVYDYNGKLGNVQSIGDVLVNGNTSEEFNIRTRNYSQLYSVGITSEGFFTDIELTIKHLPPSGATGFYVVYGGKDVSNLTNHELIPYDPTGILGSDLEDDGTLIKIKKSFLIEVGDENSSVDYIFDYGVGDEVVLYAKGISGYDILPSLYSYIIRKVDTDFIYIDRFDYVNDFGLTVAYAQIRRRVEFDGIYEEFSRYYPITGGFHSGNSQNQTGSQPAIISLKEDFSTAYVRRVTLFESIYSNVETLEISMAYSSKPTVYGRPNIVSEFSRQKKINKIRWGGKFFDQGGVNFISQFDFDDERELDERNGDIKKMQQIGDTLRVYQERKANSFYLKTVASTDADGNSTYVFDSNSVMSVGRQDINEYGCTHFESYAKNVKTAYFFDVINAEVVRDSGNGIQSITEGNYKMHSYFKQKAAEILSYEFQDEIRILGVYDYENELYIITFVDVFNAGINPETLAFHEPTGRWMSFYSFTPVRYGSLSGANILGASSDLTGGDISIYKHSASETRNNFYGQQYSSEIYVHASKLPSANKVYDSAEITSKNQWECPDYGDIEIEYPIEMKSRLVSGYWKKQEGMWRSDFLRDALSGGVSPVRNNLHNGRRLRGNQITMKLHNSDTTESNLRTVVVKSTISK